MKRSVEGMDVLSQEQIESIAERFVEIAKGDNMDASWAWLQPLVEAVPYQQDAARVLVGLIEDGWFSRQRSLELLEKIFEAHKSDDRLLGLVGMSLDRGRDIDMLNAPPPEEPLFAAVTDLLAVRARDVLGKEGETYILNGLATAARMMSRQRDKYVEASALRLLELRPDKANLHYNYGLFLKTRGRFREGMIENQRALELAAEADEAYQWNLGICATGAGEGAVALQVWKQIGNKIEMGRFNLPEGRYPQCKVRLAERPLAERTADDDDPGMEETIWMERLSPCHGIVRSVLYNDLGVDYGDVVLIDGAPITYHQYGDEEVPVFPHLATLVRREYRFFDFAGTQESKDEIAGASADLERDCIIYSHTESFRILCSECWRNPKPNHRHEESEQKTVISGRIAAPPDIPLSKLLAQLDAAMKKRAACRLYVPDLCEAVGLRDRALFERRQFDMLRSE